MSLNTRCSCFWVLIRYYQLLAQSTLSSTADLMTLERRTSTVRNFPRDSICPTDTFSYVRCWRNLGQHASQCVRRACQGARILVDCPNQSRWRRRKYCILASVHGWAVKPALLPDLWVSCPSWLCLKFVNWSSYGFLVASARDAIILADALRYGGTNKCLLWNVFASRGLGMNSKTEPYRDGYAVPAECKNGMLWKWGVIISVEIEMPGSTTVPHLSNHGGPSSRTGYKARQTMSFSVSSENC